MPPETEYCKIHAEKLDDFGDRLTDLSTDVREITRCMSQIEMLLDRSTETQKALDRNSATFEKIFTGLSNLTGDVSRIRAEELGSMKLQIERMDGNIKALEESRKGVLSVVSPVITWALVGILTGMTILFVTHGIGGSPK